jgi:hypothetical protein
MRSRARADAILLDEQHVALLMADAEPAVPMTGAEFCAKYELESL